jgi:YD repeat-containing protein
MSALRLILLTSMTTCLLVACGGEQEAKTAPAPTPGKPPAANAAKTNTNTSASAQEVAREARGKIKCPARLQTPARAADAPVDAVVGVRPGLTYDEAANVVMCTDELMVVTLNNSRHFNIQTYGQTIRQGMSGRIAKERVQKTGKQIMQEMQDNAMARGTNRVVRDVLPGESKWHVGTMGLPGEERVINAAREEWFAADRKPPIASVEKALIDKYGTPTRTRDHGNGRMLTWAYDPFGRPITETSPLFGACYGNPDPDAGVNLSPDCGIVVTATVQPPRDNPELAEYMQVGVVDQAAGYALVTSTEQAMLAQETARRAKQVEDAAKNADAPTL